VRRVVRVTEEVARWVFEVHITRHAPGWYIAFTNPTAGPWKRIMATNSDGVVGEVHRFAREETRPDLVLVNDKLSAILIVEAKGKIIGLLSSTQRLKSVAVVQDLAVILRRTNEFWAGRQDFQVVCGLLWGAEDETSTLEAAQTISAYENSLAKGKHGVLKKVIGVECLRLPQENEIACRILHLPGASQEDEQFAAKLMRSFKLPITKC